MTEQINRDEILLAPYAMRTVNSEGRVHEESPHPYRNAYQRDRDRIVHSSAFRRLAHKTQVFLGTMGDYHRSRLTHTLEVTSIARTVGRTLCLNEDLIEPLALMHDIGHPPFGHAGEDVLNECLAAQGGFNHNSQALRIVELLEQRYPKFPGLNLTREVLSGQATRAEKNTPDRNNANQQPLLEVQVVDAADNVAYDAHDPDDAIEMGLISLGELEQSHLWREATKKAREQFTALDAHETRRAVVHGVIDLLVGDLISASAKRIAEYNPRNALEVQSFGHNLIAGSTAMLQQQAELESLLFEQVYRHPQVLAQRDRAQQTLRSTFEELVGGRRELPVGSQALVAEAGLARVAGDYLASLTDRSALELHPAGVAVATIADTN